MNNDDLSIYKAHDNGTECNGSKYTECLVMRRLIKALQYRSLSNIMHNKDDEEIFRNFMNTVYPYFLNDYHHFQDYHCNELEEIQKDLTENKILRKCNMEHCQYTARHHRTETDGNDNKCIITLDPHSLFYVQMMDSLHFQLFHCFEAGLRSPKTNNNDNDDKEQFVEEKSDKYFDEAFARLHHRILSGNHRTASFHRFSPKNTKFTISMGSKSIRKDNKTYLDNIICHLMTINVDINDIKELRFFLKNAEYDSESMEYDVGLNKNGNIVKNIKNTNCLSSYIAIIKKTKLSSSSFAIGFRTYYWKYYKDLDQLDDAEQYMGININDHSGFKVKELYVEAKYCSLKEEITNYIYIQIKHYKEVLVKVNEFMQSEKIKKTTATYWSTRFLHYGIKRGEPLRLQHLLSLVLYTDYSDLCSHFSSTFRAKSVFEPLKSVIQRNSTYYWMSRYLRECVEIFGQCRHPMGMDKRYGVDRDGDDICLSKGSFYSGMNIVMNIPSFNIRVCSPTSTSKQIEIAMKFSGVDGIVLQLDVPREHQYWWLHGFNASWVSRYPEEDERLFFGGYWFIRIESIRIRATKQNFEVFVHSLYYLDVLLTGGYGEQIRINEDDVFIIQSLFGNVSNKNEKKERIKSMDDYVYSTFAAFASNKRQIILDVYRLHDADGKMRDLLMHNLHQRQHEQEEEREDTDFTNLFKAQIFDIFPNIESIIIQNTCEEGTRSYSLSIIALLSLVEIGSVQEVIVKAVNHYSKHKDTEINWINNLWNSSSKLLKTRYKEKHYRISIKKDIISNRNGYLFLINKN